MRCFAYLLLLIVIASTPLNAALSGSIGTAYKTKERFDNKNDISETEFSQFLGLNYVDYIYSPNLVLYDMRIKLEHADENRETNISSLDESTNDYQYDMKFRFFQKSYFPFQVYAKKATGELTTSLSTDSFRSIQDTLRYGIKGYFEQDSWWSEYIVSFDDIKKDSSFASEMKKTQKFDVTVGKSFGINKGRVNFQHYENEASIEEDYTAESSIKNEFIKDALTFYLEGQHAKADIGYQKNRQINKEGDINYIRGDRGYEEDLYTASYMYRPTKEFTLRTTTRYSTNEKQEIENQDILADIYWMPQKNLSINSNLFMTSLENNSSATNVYNVDVGANYRLTNKLSFSGHWNSYIIDSMTDKNSAHFLSGGVNYNKSFAKRYTYSLNANIGASKESHTDQNLENKTTFRGNFDNRLAVKFDTHNAQLESALNLFEMRSSLGEETRRLRFSMDFFGYPMDRLRYLATFSYINNMDQRYDNSKKALSSPYTNEQWEVSTKLDYTQAVGVKGKFFSGLGVKRTAYIAPDSDVALSVFADATFNYRFFHTLFYTFRGNVRDDSLNKTMEYSLFNEIAYTFRKIKISLNNEFWETSRDVGDSTSQIRTMLQLSRTF